MNPTLFIQFNHAIGAMRFFWLWPSIVKLKGRSIAAVIDFGLKVLEGLKGREAVEFMQLAIDYESQASFRSDHMRSAKSPTLAAVEGMVA